MLKSVKKIFISYKYIDIFMGIIAYLASFAILFSPIIFGGEYVLTAHYVLLPLWAIFMALAIILRKRDLGDLAWIWVSSLFAFYILWFAYMRGHLF